MKGANHWTSRFAVTAVMLATYHTTPAAESAAVFGRVTDASGAPLPHATVVVYKARVRNGYSIFCPTCWVDCGRRTITDADGQYHIDGLDPELIFQLLVIHDGFGANYLDDVDPAKSSAADATLAPRHSADDPAQKVLGLVVDSRGAPVADAVIEPKEVITRGRNGEMGQIFGAAPGLEQLAVTNERGEFELAYAQPAHSMILDVSGRGVADKLVSLPTGSERTTIVVSDGATIRGRLVQGGKPVANAEIGLITHSRYSNESYPEMRVGTRKDGTFDMTNVPAGKIYYLYGKMGSLAARGLASELVECEAKTDDQIVNVGDIQVSRAKTLRGKVLLSDNKPVPPNMRVSLFADRTSDSQMTVVGSDGSFEFRGLSKGVYEVAPAVKQYGLVEGRELEVLVNHDPTELSISLHPSDNQ
ncbi:MAG: carboxypeptidase-like regulatory domain-containing protein [Steroidobacteraceae bacterium]